VCQSMVGSIAQMPGCRYQKTGGGGGGGETGNVLIYRGIPKISRPFPKTLLHFGHVWNSGRARCVAADNSYPHRPNMDFSEIELGPKMQACTERERKFVWFYVTDDDGNASEAARKAGYADPGLQSATIRVTGHKLMHRERVLAALEEVGRKAFRGLLVPAVRATRRMIENEKHSDHAKTVLSTLSRLGKSERSGHRRQCVGRGAAQPHGQRAERFAGAARSRRAAGEAGRDVRFLGAQPVREDAGRGRREGAEGDRGRRWNHEVAK
jgi:hypothetical protein